MKARYIAGILIATVSLLTGCNNMKQEVCIKDHCFQVEVAKTKDEREKGLMFRESLGENEGMLFVLDETDQAGFWMKNTLIPLDIIWIDEEDNITHIHENAQPCEETCNPIVQNNKAKYALEVNGGTTSKFEIKEGDKISIKNI